ncbi:MAG: type III pantothenate kinase [Caldisericia bacterium]|nr:type III pantothenate kinase [Caldisericia bacterium]
MEQSFTMILTIDVGNTNIKFGFAKKRTITHFFKIATDRGKTSDEYSLLLEMFCQRSAISISSINHIVICSVVPPLNPIFESLAQRFFHIQPLFVQPGIKTGIIIMAENPKEVGADIIAGAAGAVFLGRLPAIVISFGTATVFSAVSSKKELLGVAISPGMIRSAESLFMNTAKLPRIEIKKPKNYLGRNTKDSIQSGIFFGFQGLVRTMIHGIQEEILESPTYVIGCGGLCREIAQGVPEIDIIDPILNLKGLLSIYEKNMEDSDYLLSE